MHYGYIEELDGNLTKAQLLAWVEEQRKNGTSDWRDNTDIDIHEEIICGSYEEAENFCEKEADSGSLNGEAYAVRYYDENKVIKWFTQIWSHF